MCDRAKTMSVRALRRLSETELLGLRTALETIASTETFLIARLDTIRRAASKEYAQRQRLGLTGQGEYAMAHQLILDTIHKLTWAREETEVAVKQGKIERTG